MGKSLLHLRLFVISAFLLGACSDQKATIMSGRNK